VSGQWEADAHRLASHRAIEGEAMYGAAL